MSPSLNTIKLCQTNYLDGQWTQWTEWSQCSVTCGQGTRTQVRYCAEPAPEDGGNDCIGENLYNSTCRWVTYGRQCLPDTLHGQNSNTFVPSAPIECPDCNRVCEMGTLNKECTKCTCEDHIITGTVYDEQSNPIVGASLYKFGHYDKLGVTDRVGKYRWEIELTFMWVTWMLLTKKCDIFLLRIEKICANGDDNLLMVTKKGYNPTEVWPKRTGNKTGAIDAVLTVLTPPVIIKIPEGKVSIFQILLWFQDFLSQGPYP